MNFVEHARRFLKNPPDELAKSPYLAHMRATVKFLLGNGVGKESGIPTDTIIKHLAESGLPIGREEWQQSVLGPLRDSGVWIGTVMDKHGMFIIDTKEEGEEVQAAFRRRYEKEMERAARLGKLLDEMGNR